MLALARSSIVKSPLDIWISNWQTIEIFLISWTISLCCIHYRGTVAPINHPEQCKSYTWDTGVLLSVSDAAATFGKSQKLECFPWQFVDATSLPLHKQPSCLPLWPLSRAECIWLPPETCSGSEERGGSPASCWLTCWHSADAVLQLPRSRSHTSSQLAVIWELGWFFPECEKRYKGMTERLN